ncbi:MAG: aminoglycoside phosphotransferase family protein [Nanohaloarchaea archaeon]|nr:aminoglycoside phosphotransferase family protein [Candidatus Nanohaloarchaea archaeon]
MDLRSAREYLRSQGEFDSCNILRKKTGDNNHNYIFESSNNKYVLRRKKQISEDKSLENERNILKFLEFKEIESVPRSVSYDTDREIHIITFVGQKDVEIGHLNQPDLDEWTKKLLSINRLKFSEYKDYCERKGLDYEEPRTPGENLNELREDVESLSESNGLIELLKNRLDYLEKDLQTETPGSAFLTHSDLSNSTRRTGNNFFFIDWEFSGFNQNPYSDLGIILAHSQLNKEKREAIRRKYKEKLDRKEGFDEKVDAAKQIRHIFNIVWCLQRISKSEKQDEIDRYRSYIKRQSNMLEKMSES